MKNNTSGFTIIEILIVVAIIGILMSIISVSLTGKTDEAKQIAAKATIKKFEIALKLFYNDNGFYPSTEQGLKALIIKPDKGRIPNKFQDGGYLEIKKIPKDPWGNDYVYVSPGIKNPRFVDILSYGSDAEPGGKKAAKDINNWEE